MIKISGPMSINFGYSSDYATSFVYNRNQLRTICVVEETVLAVLVIFCLREAHSHCL